MANVFTIPNVDQATVTALLARLQQEPESDVKVLGNEFYISGQGVTAQATYANGTLTVDVTEKPWYVPLSMVESKLRQAITEVQK